MQEDFVWETYYLRIWNSQHDKKRLETFLHSKMPFFRKISENRKFGESIIDKAADILRLHKGIQAKLYNHCTKRYLMMNKHPNVSSKMHTIFSWCSISCDTVPLPACDT